MRYLSFCCKGLCCFIRFFIQIIAIFNTSFVFLTNLKVRPFLASAGTSGRSFLFLAGRMTVFMPACLAARIFSLSPPIGRTSPRSVISPVIATSGLVGLPRSSETNEVNIATPALGPSLGMAPAGTWMW